MNLAGEVIWRGPEQPEQAPGAPANIMTHHAGKLSNGNYILLRNFFSVFGEDEFQGALIEEVTPAVGSWIPYIAVSPFSPRAPPNT